MTQRNAYLALLLSFSLAGCPTPTAPAPTTDAAPTRDVGEADAGMRDAGAPLADANVDARSSSTPQDFLDALVRTGCRALQACALADLGFEQGHGSITHCVPRTLRAHAYLLETPGLTFHPERVAACLEAIDRQSCASGSIPDARTWPAECRAVLEGTEAIGATCTTTLSCAAGSYCNCTGTCERGAALGESCLTMRCGAGLRCDAGGRCIADPPLPSRGEACNADGRCAGTLRCSRGTCQEVRALRQAAAGDTCVNPFDSFSTDVDPTTWCGEGLFCDFDGGYVCRRNGLAGETCDVGQLVCEEGTACLGSSIEPRVCGALLGASEACWTPWACAPQLRCVSSECVPMLELGAPCTDPTICYSGACDATRGVCVTPEAGNCRFG